MLRIALTAVVAFCSIAVYAKDDLVLKLNYDGRDSWGYSVGYQSECYFLDGKKSSVKKTEISGSIQGVLSEKKDRLGLGIENLTMASELYDEDVKNKLVEKLSAARYDVGLIDGFPSVDTEIDLSPDGLPEWNLYMQLAKLLPEVPDQPVRKGFTWERTAVLPVKSAQGKVSCEVYRQFKVEKFSAKRDSVYISWKFNYAASGSSPDSASIMKYVPIGGKGEGKAVIDIANGFVTRAEMTFNTPVISLDKVKVNWKEKAVLEYKPSK